MDRSPFLVLAASEWPVGGYRVLHRCAGLEEAMRKATEFAALPNGPHATSIRVVECRGMWDIDDNWTALHRHGQPEQKDGDSC
jgi:hypothetical protein